MQVNTSGNYQNISHQLSMHSYNENCEQPSEMQPCIEKKKPSNQDNFREKKDKLFDSFNILDSQDGSEEEDELLNKRTPPPSSKTNSNVKVHNGALNQKNLHYRNIILDRQTNDSEVSKLRYNLRQQDYKEIQTPVINKRQEEIIEIHDAYKSTSAETQRQQRASKDSRNNQYDNKGSSRPLHSFNTSYVTKQELPDIINYLARNVIKTLEPLIDEFINQRMLLQEQKLLELTSKLEYVSKSVDLKFDIYQQQLQSQIHQLQLSSCQHLSSCKKKQESAIFSAIGKNTESVKSHQQNPYEYGAMAEGRGSSSSSSFMEYISKQNKQERLGSSDFVLSMSDASKPLYNENGSYGRSNYKPFQHHHSGISKREQSESRKNTFAEGSISATTQNE